MYASLDHKSLQLQNREIWKDLENVAVGIQWVDSNGLILWANQAELELLKLRREDYIGHNISEFHIDKHASEDILNTLKRNETLRNFEARVRCGDGSIKYVCINSNALWKNGKFLHTRCFTHDITKIKELEFKKDHFISIASHELKTPIATLKGLNQILQLYLKDQEMPSHYLAKMDVQINRLQLLINELLDVSRMQSGKLNLQKELFSLNDLIKETVLDLGIIFPSHILEFQKVDSIEVFADRDRLSQVLINLISNAVKFSPNGKRVVISCLKDARKVTVCVEDFGIGISNRDLDRIFEPFFQAKNTIRKSFSGIGLGLHISKHIIKRHKGRMWVDSLRGKGSKFYFQIPT